MRLRNARVTASVRLATPNLDRMFFTWLCTVSGLIWSRWARRKLMTEFRLAATDRFQRTGAPLRHWWLPRHETLGQRIGRRWTKHSPESVGSERLHDAHGEVTVRINPPDMGMVKVLGEIWRAESDVVIELGASVRVKKVIGNHLVVAPKTESQQ